MKISTVLLQRSLYDLSRDLSWADHKRKGYVIRDPADADELLYLTEAEYNKLIRVMISNESSIEVVATPRDTPASILRKFPGPKTGSGESPLLGLREFAREFLFDLLPGWSVKDSMISFERNFDKFIPIYYKHINSWMNLKPSLVLTKAVWKVGKHLGLIKESRGINQVILKLKISSIVVLKYLGGERLTSTQDLGQRIKLIAGLPAFLPVSLRHLIRSKSIDQIRVIISLLHSYKGMQGIYGDPDLSTISAPPFRRPPKTMFSNILDLLHVGGTDILNVYRKGMPTHEDWDEVYNTREEFWSSFNPTDIKCSYQVEWDKYPMVLSAGPNDSVAFRGANMDAFAHFLFDSGRGLLSFMKALSNDGDKEGDMSLPKFRPDMPFIPNDKFGYKRIYQQMEHLVQGLKDKGPLGKQDLNNLSLGKLSLKEEAAGKIRIFAISDYWTQLVFTPIHKSMFKILRHHPSDATFDQLGKVSAFMSKGHTYIASFDLKAATDLIPQPLYIHAMEPFFGSINGQNIAQLWMDVLVKREYKFTYAGVTKLYTYTRGQPMGTLSSWSSLAIIHHYLVFLAARRSGRVNFIDYLVLGDDIIIADKAVAESYQQVCLDYGITIGLPKSYISNNGFFQFASQDILGDINISPISLKEVMSITRADTLTKYNSGITSIAAKVEFVNRMLWKGFVKGNNPFNLVRSVVSYRDWRIISRSLSRGILPSKIVNVLLMLLSSPVRVRDNTFGVSQLMAVLYRDMSCLTKTKQFKPATINFFLADLIKLLDTKFKADFRQVLLKLGDQGYSDLRDTYLKDLFDASATNIHNVIGEQLVEVRKEWDILSKEIHARIANNDLHFLLEADHITELELSLTDVLKYNKLLMKLNSIQTTVSVVTDVNSSLGVSSTPKQVKYFLSLQRSFDRQGETMSWVGALQ